MQGELCFDRKCLTDCKGFVECEGYMRKGNVLVEQVTEEGNIIKAYDESLSSAEIYDIVSKYFPKIQKLSIDSRIMIGVHKGFKFAIRCKNVTYLGKPHPHYKKRIQISDDLYDFYRIALSIEAEPILLGVYSCGNHMIFVDFKIDTYINRKAHNSSAHIYISDLAAATEEGYFQKIDYNGNTITAIRPDVVNIYLDELFKIDDISEKNPKVLKKRLEINKKEFLERNTSVAGYIKEDNEKGKQYPFVEKIQPKQKEFVQHVLSYAEVFRNEIIPKIKEFFEDEEKEWHGIECYKKMIEANYRNKYQPEWVGFFLEYEFEKYLSNKNLKYLITYAQDKKVGGVDLDLFFPTIESYGDLKAHSEDSRGIQGNDWDTIWRIINKQDEKSHVYYIVCEHSTEKDSYHDYEVTKFWNTMQKKTNIMSYSTRMKNNVRLKRVYVLDINYSNKEYLTMFKQGINSNGKPRAPKIMIEQDKLKYFIVEQINL